MKPLLAKVRVLLYYKGKSNFMEVIIMAGLKKSSENVKDAGKVIDQIESEEMRGLNLEDEIAEDGYVHDIPLLAGYRDKDGMIHTTFSFREMNGKDEEAISKADIRSNGAKLANTLVERCVNQIGTIYKKDVGLSAWSEIVRELLGGDIDYMVFKIRELSKGKEVEFQHTCPHCGQKLTTIVNTDEFNIKPFLGMYEIPFELKRGYKDPKKEYHKTGKLRLPNGFDREIVTPLFKKNSSTATSMLLTRLMSFDDGAYVLQNNVAEMTLRDREILEKIVAENSFGIDTTLDIVCSSCGMDISGEVGQSNFF